MFNLFKPSPPKYIKLWADSLRFELKSRSGNLAYYTSVSGQSEIVCKFDDESGKYKTISEFRMWNDRFPIEISKSEYIETIPPEYIQIDGTTFERQSLNGYYSDHSGGIGVYCSFECDTSLWRTSSKHSQFDYKIAIPITN